MANKQTMQAAADNKIRGRLAPSPTGYLHLGNAWSFLMAWLMVRKNKGTLVLRMEDIDTERSKECYAEAILEDLLWLGLNWDEGYGKASDNTAYMQSTQYAYYTDILQKFQQKGFVYPCFCSRKELRSLMNAPHTGDYFTYPGICRKLTMEEQYASKLHKAYSLRFQCPWNDCEEKQLFTDIFMGKQALSWNDSGGDVPLMRSDAVVAYQLAVVADDIRMNINQVVRGNDILPSTVWQLGLYKALNAAPPEYGHVALLCDEQGERLAKRHCSLTIRALREQGVQPELLLALLAVVGGLVPHVQVTAMNSYELLEKFVVPAIMPDTLIVTQQAMHLLQKNKI